MEPAIRVRIDVHEDDADDQHVETLTSNLRDALLDLDVESVDKVSGAPAPEGSKGGGLLEIGSLLTTLIATPALLTSVVDLVRTWLGGRDGRSVTMKVGDDEIEIKGVSDDAERELVSSWVARHSTPA